MLKERESARATSTVYPFPLIAEQRKCVNTDGDSAKRLSTWTWFLNRVFPLLSPFAFSFLEINPLMILKLCITPITPHVKSNVLQLYYVNFNYCRLFEIAKTADFLLRCSVLEEGEGENGALVFDVWCLRNTAVHNQWTRPTRTRAPHSHVHYRTRALMRDP